jgi:hypothetical protein
VAFRGRQKVGHFWGLQSPNLLRESCQSNQIKAKSSEWLGGPVPAFGDEIRFSASAQLMLKHKHVTDTLTSCMERCKLHLKSCTSAISSRQKPICSADMISTAASDWS